MFVMQYYHAILEPINNLLMHKLAKFIPVLVAAEPSFGEP